MKVAGSSGFTLLETLVSMMLLAVMSVMAYQAIEAVLNANQRNEMAQAGDLEIQQAWQIMTNDFLHLRARPYADGFGGIEAAYQTGTSDILLSFTRGGGAPLESNPTGLNRVQYSLDEEGQLIRTVWPVYVSYRDSDGQQRVILHNVEEIEFNQLSELSYYSLNWPPLDLEGEDNTTRLPLMVEVNIEMQDGTSTHRLFPGAENNG